MPKVTIEVPDDLKEKMARHEEVNWAGLLRRSIERHLRVLEIADQIQSDIDAEDVREVAALVKRHVAERTERELHARRRGR